MPLIVYPKTRFFLTERQAAGQFSRAGIWRLERKAGVPKLEKALSGYLSQMPQMYLRGSSDRRTNGYSSFLVSPTPIRGPRGDDREWLLPPSECTAPIFFRKLFVSVTTAWSYGWGHLQLDMHASEVVLSIDIIFNRIEQQGYNLCSPRCGGISDWLNDRDESFPVSKTRNLFLLAQLRYPREDFSGLNGADTNRLFTQRLQINGFIYRDTLRLLLELAKSNWPKIKE